MKWNNVILTDPFSAGVSLFDGHADKKYKGFNPYFDKKQSEVQSMQFLTKIKTQKIVFSILKIQKDFIFIPKRNKSHFLQLTLIYISE